MDRVVAHKPADDPVRKCQRRGQDKAAQLQWRDFAASQDPPLQTQIGAYHVGLKQRRDLGVVAGDVFNFEECFVIRFAGRLFVFDIDIATRAPWILPGCMAHGVQNFLVEFAGFGKQELLLRAE